MNFGLKTSTIEAIQQCLSHHSKIEEAIVYGSRAKGNFHPGSDIDLTLKGKNLTLSDVARLEEDIDDLLLPYKFDISLYHQISNTDLLDHIHRAGRIFYKRSLKS